MSDQEKFIDDFVSGIYKVSCCASCGSCQSDARDLLHEHGEVVAEILKRLFKEYASGKRTVKIKSQIIAAAALGTMRKGYYVGRYAEPLIGMRNEVHCHRGDLTHAVGEAVEAENRRLLPLLTALAEVAEAAENTERSLIAEFDNDKYSVNFGDMERALEALRKLVGKK